MVQVYNENHQMFDNIFHFCRKIEALKDTIILQPKELIDAMRAVIRCKEICIGFDNYLHFAPGMMFRLHSKKEMLER